MLWARGQRSFCRSWKCFVCTGWKTCIILFTAFESRDDCWIEPWNAEDCNLWMWTLRTFLCCHVDLGQLRWQCFGCLYRQQCSSRCNDFLQRYKHYSQEYFDFNLVSGEWVTVVALVRKSTHWLESGGRPVKVSDQTFDRHGCKVIWCLRWKVLGWFCDPCWKLGRTTGHLSTPVQKLQCIWAAWPSDHYRVLALQFQLCLLHACCSENQRLLDW